MKYMSATVLSPADASAKLLDVQAVAEMLGCSQRHIYRLSDAGRMPAPLRLGTLVRWSKSSIESWVADGCPSVRKTRKSAVSKEKRR
jgi:excisionase family DNA binding protein